MYLEEICGLYKNKIINKTASSGTIRPNQSLQTMEQQLAYLRTHYYLNQAYDYEYIMILQLPTFANYETTICLVEDSLLFKSGLPGSMCPHYGEECVRGRIKRKCFSQLLV